MSSDQKIPQSAIPFVRDFDYDYGRCDRLSDRIRRVICANPGPFTFTGTGTYIVGTGQVAVIDPGPIDDAHLKAILAALDDGETVSHILITHTHMDHSPLADALKAETGAKVYAYLPPKQDEDAESVEAGADGSFQPDVVLADGDQLTGPDWTMTAIHTPGHMSNHLCFSLEEEKILFTGDHIMGWSTSVISPPDGNMRDYMASLQKLLDRDDERYWPTHGPHIDNPQRFVRAYIAHRKMRDAQILRCIDDGVTRIPDMVTIMYANVDKGLHRPAARSVLAHIERMIEDGELVADGATDLSAIYSRA